MGLRTPKSADELADAVHSCKMRTTNASPRSFITSSTRSSRESTRLRLQAHQGYETLKSFDRIDPHYLQLWLDFIYGNMYTRGILDDRTRLLMMVGICLAANEPVQLENHLRGSLMQGATPRASVAKLHTEIVRILALPEIRERLVNEGATVVASTPEEYAVFMRNEVARMTQIIKASNMSVD